uniref:Serine protease inhibitor Kazal-type 9 n=1 Tax=Callorhinus ursinus TaxID=34884 RepID=A0A3Q7NNT5_CALUR|nr:serine protease inhibitor Kazal-type 9 [Callorhinus ursinus]
MKATACALLLALALMTIFSENPRKLCLGDCIPAPAGDFTLTAVNIKKSPPGKEGFCHEIYAPICGSDGKTYPNDCFFCFEVQKTDNKLKFVHFGKC